MIPLGLTVAIIAAYAGMQKKICGSGTTTLVILNQEMEGIMKIDKSLADFGLLMDSVNKTIEKKKKSKILVFLVIC